MAGPKKILIVDDEKYVTDTLEGFFRSKGYKIFKAQDGRTSLSFITNEKPDLVLLDIKLPSVDGIDILRLLRQFYSGVKVIVMTAYDREYKTKAESIGYDALFLKPILIDELIIKVEELLSRDPAVQQTEITETRIPEGVLPKARLLIVSLRDPVLSLIRDFFAKQNDCQGVYEIVGLGLEQLEYVKDFQPDIVLLDVALIGALGEFGLTLMKLPQPPKEIIIFGDPAAKWEEVETLLKNGAKQDNLLIKEILSRLNNSVKEICAKHRLFTRS